MPGNDPVTRRPRRSARSALLWALLALALGHVAFVALADAFAPEVYDPEYAARLRRLRARHAEHPDRPLLVLMGSSRTDFMFAPELLPPLHAPDGRCITPFNFSRCGGGPVYARLAYRRLHQQNLTPDYLVVELMPLLLMSDAERYFYYGATADELGDLSAYSSPRRAVGCYAKYRYIPWRSNRAGLVRAFAPALSLPFESADPERLGALGGPGLRYGREVVFPAEARRRQTAAVVADNARLTAGYRVGPGPDRALRDLARECRAAGTRLVILRTPEASSLRASYSPEARAALDEYQARFRREFGVPVVDASAWLPDEYFSDGHHGVSLGQAAFTARLHRDVLAPLVAGTLSAPDAGLATR